MPFAIKVLLSALIVAIVSSVARRLPAAGALIAALPLVSVLGMVWLWLDTHDPVRMRQHVAATFWFVLPSLPMFLAIPALMRGGMGFWLALALGCVLTMVLYALTIPLAARFGVRL